MRRALLILSSVLLVGFGASFAHPSNPQDNPEKSKPAEETKVPADDAAKVNPVKATAEGLAEARKVFGYDCAMCHGEKGDGKGDVVESMKLTMRDWREPAALAGKTDGELYYIITKGKGKMMGEGDRVPNKLRWNLVNLVRALAVKSTEQKSAAASPAP
jgi:mono/diheme cytochrome c family protein